MQNNLIHEQRKERARIGNKAWRERNAEKEKIRVDAWRQKNLIKVQETQKA